MRDEDNQSEIAFREDARATKASGFCMDDSHDLNKKGKEGSSAQRFLRDEDNQSEIVFREDARATYMGDNSNFNSNSDFDSSSNSNSNSNSNYQEDLTSQGKFVQDLRKIFTPRHTNLLNSRGSVLIEFAVCMPILIILLFYINDLVRIKRYYSQTEFVAQQMANILQNISQKRDDKTITRQDVNYALSLAYLSMYPGTTMFTVKSGSACHTLNHQPRIYIHCVKGQSGGKASTMWSYMWRTGAYTTPSRLHYVSLANTEGYSDGNVVYIGQNVSPSAIYPTLKIEEGQTKIIIECQIRWQPSDQRDVNGKTAGSAREVFGCHFVNPKCHDKNKVAYFVSVVIFTPKPGLFGDTAPA